MKNKLREQLRTLAQQILEEEKTFRTAQIKSTVLEIYNQLTVLEYLELQIGGASGESQEESLDSKSFREENWFTEPEPVPQPAHEEDLVEPLMEKIKDLVAHMPEESGKIDDLLNSMIPKEQSEEERKEQEREQKQEQERKDKEEQERREREEQERKEREEQERKVREEQERKEKEEQERKKRKEREEQERAEQERKQKQDENESPKNAPAPTRNELEEFASAYQRMPEFERKNPELFPPSTGIIPASKKVTDSRPRSINDTIKKGLNVGLNDRLAFVKHLFEGHTEDYTRVLSQINTMNSFEEAERFITENVKPDYHNWENKEVYAERFMNIIEKRFD